MFRYRSEIANSETIRSDLPPAEDMRKLSWDPELASLAEMWAAQCSSEHEAVRKVIIDGEELDVRILNGEMEWKAHFRLSVCSELDRLQREE